MSERTRFHSQHLFSIPNFIFLPRRYFFRPGISLTKQKEGLLRDRDRLTAEIEELNKRVQQYQIQNDILDKKRNEYEEKCRDLYRMLDVCCLRMFIDNKNYLCINVISC